MILFFNNTACSYFFNQLNLFDRNLKIRTLLVLYAEPSGIQSLGMYLNIKNINVY